MWNETKKILGDEDVHMTCTAVRVPVMGGHSESVYLEFEHPFELHEVRQKLADFPGVVVQDEPAHNRYPCPYGCRQERGLRGTHSAGFGQ